MFLVVQRLTLDAATYELGMQCLHCLQSKSIQLIRNKLIIVIDEGTQLAQEIRCQLEASCCTTNLNYQFVGMLVNESLGTNLENIIKVFGVERTIIAVIGQQLSFSYVLKLLIEANVQIERL